MTEIFYIYSIDDIGGDPSILVDGSFLASVSSDAAPDFARVNDNDPILDILATGDSDQVLAADLVIDGVTVGTAGDAISIGNESNVTNFSAGSVSGVFSQIIVNGVVVGFASTIELNPNDALSISPATSPGSPQDYASFAACFTRDTRILCKHGEVPVQNLKVGDLVLTRDNGPQPIRWIGSQKTRGHGDMAPVHFKAGTVGNSRDIVVSPMHRMLINGPRAELLFGTPELLAHAKDLSDGDRIFCAPQDTVTYYHILFDDHQLISAYGCWSESFAPHHEALDAFEAKSQAEILALFPRLEQGWQDTLPTLSAPEAALLSEF